MSQSTEKNKDSTVTTSLNIWQKLEVEIAVMNRHKTKLWEPKPGWVYLLLSHIGLFKIGESVDPAGRLERLQRKRPNERIYLVHQFKADNTYEAEEILLRSFNSKKHSYDWFRLDLEDIDLIHSIVGFKDGEFIFDANGQDGT